MSTFSTKEVQTIYNAVFRDSTSQPGFYFRDFGSEIGAKPFREQMIDLKNKLSSLCEAQQSKRLNYQSLGRFNHQHSSKFHRDTSDANSFLMLGYEPTKIDSKVCVADYTRYFEHQNKPLDGSFDGYVDTNIVDNDQLPSTYVTELSPFIKSNYRLLFLNNGESFGVFHGAEVANIIDNQDRVINYMMMYLCDLHVDEPYSTKNVIDFVNMEKIDR